MGWIEIELRHGLLPLGSKTHRFLARQAIVDQMGKIHGYELLYRSGPGNHFIGDSDLATRTMIDNCLLHGFEDLTGEARSFVNCTREALVEGFVTLLPSSRTVLELLETIEPDEEVIEACRSMKQIGYGIALDDFQFSKKMEPLVELADYAKIDSRSEKSQRMMTLRQLEGSGVKLVAEKVETEDELRIAFEEGCELFQGYLFGRPTVYSKCKSPINAEHNQRLLETLYESWHDVDKMIRLAKSEASICQRLRRLARSVALHSDNEVRSIEEAMAIIGENRFHMLAMLALETEICEKRDEAE